MKMKKLIKYMSLIFIDFFILMGVFFNRKRMVSNLNKAILIFKILYKDNFKTKVTFYIQ